MRRCNSKAIMLQIVIINPTPRNVHSKAGIISTLDVINEIIQPVININVSKGKFLTNSSPPINTSLNNIIKIYSDVLPFNRIISC